MTDIPRPSGRPAIIHTDDDTPLEVDQVFDEFWRHIVMHDGQLDVEQVKRELHDYHVLLLEVPKVYMEISRGRISKPHTVASEVIGVHDDLWDRKEDLVAAEAVCDALLAHEKHGGSIPWPSIKKPFEAWKAGR